MFVALAPWSIDVGWVAVIIAFNFGAVFGFVVMAVLISVNKEATTGDPTGQDEARKLKALLDARKHDDLELCERCDGTGNEFFSMYRQCQTCRGIGTTRKADDES